MARAGLARVAAAPRTRRPALLRVGTYDLATRTYIRYRIRACVVVYGFVSTCFHFLPGFSPFRGGIPRSVEIGKFILNSALDPSESPDSDIFTKHFQTFSNSALARRCVMSIIQIRSMLLLLLGILAKKSLEKR